MLLTLSSSGDLHSLRLLEYVCVYLLTFRLVLVTSEMILYTGLRAMPRWKLHTNKVITTTIV